MTTASYNKSIYGEPKMSNEAIMRQLEADKAFQNGQLLYWPEWFEAAEYFSILEAGLITTKTSKPYAATTIRKASQPVEVHKARIARQNANMPKPIRDMLNK